MVLTHSNCGAVKAAIEGGEAKGHLSSITSIIRKALDEVKTKSGDLLDNTIRANATLTSEKLKMSEPILIELVNDGKLKVVSAYYHLSSGKVEVLS